jgi:hypothetical protein
MEKAAYKYLHVALNKRDALGLYYQLTTYIRENDPSSFGRLMELNDGTLQDHTLMTFVLDCMLEQHPKVLQQAIEPYTLEV